MLLSVKPVSIILLLVLVDHFSLSVSLPLDVVSLVNTSIRPGVFSVAVFLVVKPFSFVPLTIFELQNTEPVHFVVFKMTVKYFAFLNQDSFPVPLIVQKLPVVATTIWVLSLSLPVG